MCFHWCSACGMLQTGMGKEKQQKAFFSFFNSILPVRRFSVGVYSFISTVRLRPVRQQCLHCCWCCCCSLAGLDPSDSLVLLLLPLSLAHSSPHSLPLLSLSLSLSRTQVLWENSRSSMRPSSFPLSDTDILLCMFPVFFAMFFCPSHFQSFIPSFSSIFSVFPHLLGCLSFSLHDAARLCWLSSSLRLCLCPGM